MGDACTSQPTADDIQNSKQEQITRQGVESVGMPAITNFAEKQQYRDILELRDKSLPTFTYLADMNGHLHFLCRSIGFGIPYATQYTNPSQIHYTNNIDQYRDVIPQADPNGLYAPAAAEGTWVLCLDPLTGKLKKLNGKVEPVYIEPRITVSPFELASVK
jgi:hypothetical protein